MTPSSTEESQAQVRSIPAPRRRSGRRPGESGTREAILQAARKVFAQRGYGGATMRAIAREADVDAALIHHFFDSKEGVFQAAITSNYRIGEIIDYIAEADPDTMGERFVRGYLELWNDPATQDPLLALIRSAVSDEDASGLMCDFFADNLVAPLLRTLDASEPELRATLVGSQLVGLAVVRYVIRIEPLASADVESLVRAVGPTIQRYLMADLSSPDWPEQWRKPRVPVPLGSQGLFREPRF